MSEFATRRVSVGDGLAITARDYAPAGAAKDLPVLCLHGLTRNSADFEAVAPALAADGRRVLALDMRGRGASDWDPKPERYHPDVYLHDTLAAMDELDVASAIVLGTSMGGLIAMLMAATAPDRLAAAILNDVGPVLNPAGLARIVTYVGKTGPFASWSAVEAALRDSQGAAFPRAVPEFWPLFGTPHRQPGTGWQHRPRL